MDLKNISPLRWYAQKILPLVYDESLSYYEVLAKVTKKLNELIESDALQNEILSNITDFDPRITALENEDRILHTEINGLQTNVDLRFANISQHLDAEIARVENEVGGMFKNPDSYASGAGNGRILAVNNYNQLVWKDANELQTVVPAGGVTGQVLMKRSGTDYDTTWGNGEGVPIGGTTAQVLVKNSDDNYDVGWATPTSQGDLPEARLIPQGGEKGEFLTKQSGENYSVGWNKLEDLDEFKDVAHNVHLGSDGNTIWLFEDAEQTPLSFNTIKELIENEKNSVYLTNGNYSFYNKYKYFPMGGENAIGFIGETQLEGKVYSYRIVINSNNEVKSDEIEVAKVSYVNEKISNRNLLDNPWFTVNQRGETSYSSESAIKYTVDRWYLGWNNSLNVNDGYITLYTTLGPSQFYQKLETSLVNFLRDKTVTLSVMDNNGNVYSRSGNNGIVLPLGNNCNFVYDLAQSSVYFVNDNNIQLNIKAVKLELGSVSTLANDIVPNYAEELAKCQRYQIECFDRVNTGQAYICLVTAINATEAYGILPIPATMRVRPVLHTDCSVDNPYTVFGIFTDGYKSSVLITDIGVYQNVNNGIAIRATGTNMIAGNQYQLYVRNQNTHTFLLDANM